MQRSAAAWLRGPGEPSVVADGDGQCPNRYRNHSGNRPHTAVQRIKAPIYRKTKKNQVKELIKPSIRFPALFVTREKIIVGGNRCPERVSKLEGGFPADWGPLHDGKKKYRTA